MKLSGQSEYYKVETHPGFCLVMIIYDVSDNRHRTQLMKILREYGQRVQRSSFECLLTEKQYRELLGKINRLAWKEDLIR
ncbi:MAG: CRISPR-associated endonuclease Cas2, partial [Eubacteriaceae bacterium]